MFLQLQHNNNISILIYNIFNMTHNIYIMIIILNDYYVPFVHF